MQAALAWRTPLAPVARPSMNAFGQCSMLRSCGFAPVERVILFGGRARGDPDAESDRDPCVLLHDDIPSGGYAPGAVWRAVRGLGLTLQVVPLRKSVFEAARTDINALAHDVAQDGVVLFDAAMRQR